MSYELSFTEEFFSGSEETQVTDRPTSVFEAVENLSFDEKVAISNQLFENSIKTKAAVFHAESESFAWDVLEKVRETNTCSNLTVPVRVWIDRDGNFTVDVYDKDRE